MTIPPARLVRGTIGPAPRAVPRRLVLRLLFGTVEVQLMWMFPLFGILAALGIQHTRVTYRATTTGTVTKVVDTNRRDDDDELYRVEFELVDDSGVHHTGSFETTADIKPGPQELAYDPADPSHARLPDTFGGRMVGTAFSLLFVALGLAYIVSRFHRGRAALRLLRYGEPTTGRIVDRQVGDSETPDYLTFEYKAAGKAYRLPHVVSDPRIEDDAEEPMIYDVKNPSHAATLDNLPGKPQVREDGTLACKPGLGVHVVVLPAVFAIATVAWLALLLRS